MNLITKIKAKLGDLWWYTLLFMIVQRIGDVVNLGIGIFYVPSIMSQDELGAVTPLISIPNFIGLPIIIMLLPVGKFLNVFATRGEMGKVKQLLRDVLLYSVCYLLFAIAVMMLFSRVLLERLHLGSVAILCVVAMYAMVGSIEPMTSNALRSLKCFNGILWGGFFAPYVRLLVMLLLLAPLGALGYMTAQFSSSLFMLVFSLVVLYRFVGKGRKGVSYREDLPEMVKYALPLVGYTIAENIQGPVEAFVIRHRLSAEISAGYYFVYTFAQIPGYVSSALVAIFWPIVSEKFEKKESTDAVLTQSMVVNFTLGILALVAVSTLLPLFFKLPGAWQKYAMYAKYVWIAGAIVLVKSIRALYVAHESASRNFGFVKFSVIIMLLESAVLYGLPAWGTLEGIVPNWLYFGVRSIWHDNLITYLLCALLFNLLITGLMCHNWLKRRKNNEK